MYRPTAILFLALAGCAGTSVPAPDWIGIGDARRADGDLDGALGAWREAVQIPGRRAEAWFRTACARAAAGQHDHAFHALTAAKRAGFSDREAMDAAPDLAPLRDDERFVLPVERHLHVVHLEDGSQLTIGVWTPHDAFPLSPHPFLLVSGEPRPDDSVHNVLWGEAAVQRGWIAVESGAFGADDPAQTTAYLMDLLETKFRVEDGKFHLLSLAGATAGMLRAAVAVASRVGSVTALGGTVPEDLEEDLKWLGGPVRFYPDGDPAADAARRRLHPGVRRMTGSDRSRLAGGGLMELLDQERSGRAPGRSPG